jgi:23S rRNA (guanosine2251-2'-O)-methyltransferase
MVIYGKQPILYLVEKHKNIIQKIFLAKDIDREIFKKFIGIKIERLDDLKAQAMARGGNHQGILAEISEFETINYREILEKSSFIVILHSLTDVGNIGSIIRTAYSLGVNAIIITGLNSLKFEGIARSSAGALFDSKIAVYKNIFDILNEAKQLEFKIYGATLDGEDIRNYKNSDYEKKILILGNEESGLSGRVLNSLDKKITIKMDRDFDSLNVSVAGAILIDRLRNSGATS